jgi:hypothetical protein
MPPGQYTVRLIADSATLTRPLTVIGNPAAPMITQADYDAQYRTALAVRDTISAINAVLKTIRALPQAKRDSLAAIERALLAQPTPPSIVAPARLLAQFGALYAALVGDGGYGAGSAEGRPLAGPLARKRDLEAQWLEIRRQFMRAMGAPVP